MINYPWDDSPQAKEGEKSVCPDDDVFSEISAIYANNHPFMWTGWVVGGGGLTVIPLFTAQEMFMSL